MAKVILWKAACFHLRQLQEEVTNMKSENESFRMVHAELLRTSHPTATKGDESSVEKMMNTIPRSYLGVSIDAGKKIPVWNGSETMKVVPFGETDVHNWTNRSENVQNCDVFFPRLSSI